MIYFFWNQSKTFCSLGLASENPARASMSSPLSRAFGLTTPKGCHKGCCLFCCVVFSLVLFFVRLSSFSLFLCCPLFCFWCVVLFCSVWGGLLRLFVAFVVVAAFEKRGKMELFLCQGVSCVFVASLSVLVFFCLVSFGLILVGFWFDVV